jgi:UDP-2,3-diacylglucosamine pyrophosphatase LpxH
MSPAPEKKIVVVVSDLHLGEGVAPLDDHVFDERQFERFVDSLAQGDGKDGGVELFVNGDFLDFAQVGQKHYTLGSATFWCSEPESLAKLELILAGHSAIFNALGRFQTAGNALTIAAGNHDVDLYWPKVQERLRKAAGAQTRFEFGVEEYMRFDGRLLIGHGHMIDPANRFEHWGNPILSTGKEQRLEMCPGTLFMVKFVNPLEDLYPFADNIKPITALGRVLAGENKLGLLTVSWMLARFAARYPVTTMGKNGFDADILKRLHDLATTDERARKALLKLCRYANADLSAPSLLAALENKESAEDLLMAALQAAPPGDLEKDLNVPLGISLSIMKSGQVDEKAFLRSHALSRLKDGPRFAVFGHTHQPDEAVTDDGRKYFNPGSWTRYVEISDMAKLHLADLMDESRFPYQLNYVHVESTENGLIAAMRTVAERKPHG